MTARGQYIIPFIGLKQGLHTFQYEIAADFFAAFPESPLSESKLHVEATFDKQEDFFLLNFSVEGTVRAPCDRCNAPFDLELLDEHQLVIKFEDGQSTVVKHDGEEIVYISRNETQLDISQWIYEFINLSLPIKVIHPLDEDGNNTCDQATLAVLENHTQTSKAEADPRWDPLSNVK